MKKVYLNLTVCFALFIIGLFFLYNGLINNGFGFFNLQTFGKGAELGSKLGSELIKGDVIRGEFKSRFSNLGIVSVRFTNNNRDSKDKILFRIKEQNTNNWQYLGTYNTDQFLPEQLFPFGFPVINDSAEKNYVFEIESLSGATGSGIFLSSKDPVFTASYFYDKNSLLDDKYILAKFFLQKILNTFDSEQTKTLTITAFLPFFFYLIYIKVGNTHITSLLPIFWLGIALDIFYLPTNNNYYIGSLIFLWILISSKRKIRLESEGIISLLLLLTSFITFLMGKNIYAEKSMVWFLISTSMSAIQAISMQKTPAKNDLSLFAIFQQFKFIFDSKKTISTKTTKVVVVALMFASTYILYSLVNIIYSGFALFPEFYPNDLPYLSIVILTTNLSLVFALAGYLVHFLRKNNNLNILLTFSVLIFMVYPLANLVISKSTTFRYETKIHSVSPSSTNEAWVDITITGKNFQDIPFTGKVTVAGEVQVENVLLWSDEKIIFRTNPSTTKTGDICVQTVSKGKSNCLPFEYNFNQKK